MTEERAWFEYSRTPGRFTAKPVGLVGWLVFLSLLPLPMLLLIEVGPAALRVHPLLFVALLLTVFGCFFVGLVWLVRVKGRQVR